ncbi:uncharacterized protein YMR317W isoform X2 [Siniperca chuatsi]|uniref:uncharacterized protein YMR317W isoform X2 n=1 Tax=Siniperca chuatsi TaxID=119488 RepID=UPI001CE06243|nr:uncharacterized protein YMR317W isoform X2 [Siniperca chuatsi]
MEETELQPGDTSSQSFQKLPLWIIEYVWAHKRTDIQEVVDPSTWPEVDSQPLSLEDSWRLRVASAHVYSIVKNRDMAHFERVMGFLEATYRLLPRLVAPIKHMKIMFGLKTMSQHEMFLMRKNHVDFKALAQALAMDKDKLEDYIKNQMEKQYGEHYAQKVEDRLLHYLHELETVLPGETYIDKILKKESPVTEEEKLLLEVITSDSTTIATTLKKLLHCDVASCRPGRVSQSSERNAKNGMESSQLSKSVLYGSSSKALLKSVEAKTPLEFQPEVFRGGEEPDQYVSKDSPLFLENDNGSDIRRHQQTEEDGEVVKSVEKESSDKENGKISQRSSERVHKAASSPQFCSKHQRWVKSILQECPDECSEELLLQANVSSSPLLFQSSSSTSSSQDLTPSNLIPCPPDQQHPPSQTSTHLQTAAQASEQTNPEDMLSSRSPGSASDTSKMEPLPQPSSSRDTLLPALWSPVVRLIDIACIRGIYPTFKPHQESPNHFTMSSNKQAASTSSPQVLTSPHRHTSGNDTIFQGTTEDSTFDQPETVAPTNPPKTMHKVQTAPVSQDASTSTRCQTPTRQSSSRLSRKFRRTCTTTRHSQALGEFSQNPLAEQLEKTPTTFWTSCSPLPNDFNVSGPPTQDASTSTSQSGTLSTVCTANQIPLSTESSQQVVPQNSIKPHSQTHNISPFQSKTLPCVTVLSSTSNSNCLAVRSETSRVQRTQLRISLPSQVVLLQSKLLQPYVSLTRLSAQECYQVTKGRSSTKYVEPVVQDSNNYSDEDRKDEEEAADSSFDLNILYSSHSSKSDSEDSLDWDPDYKPCIKKKRLLLEYETARNLNHI